MDHYTNPVKDHLVEKAHHWPGVLSLGPQLANNEVVAQRPHWSFSSEGKMPDVARIRFQRPPPFAHLTQEQWANKIRDAVAARERAAADARRETGRGVLGRRAVRTQSAFDCPQSCIVVHLPACCITLIAAANTPVTTTARHSRSEASCAA